MTPSGWKEWALLIGMATLVLIYAALALAARKAPTVREDRCPNRWLLRDGRECEGPCHLDERGRTPCA